MNTTLYNSEIETKDIVKKRGAFGITTAVSYNSYDDVLFDRKIELATEGMEPFYATKIRKLSKDNALTITNYVLSMKAESNLLDGYRKLNILSLCYLSKFFDNKKPYKRMTRDDILQYLNSVRKPEASDPLHKWIGTYNIYRMLFIRFFKWLNSPDIELHKRPKPSVVENIPLLKRKEQSIYKPSDLWTLEDDLVFLKYCPSKRIKCYHTMSRDLSCRPHEILKLRIKDIQFKTAGNHQYAEVLVRGKTGSRPIPLIDSIPYVKDYLDHEHPQLGNPNAIFLSGIGKSLGRTIGSRAVSSIYLKYKRQLFPKLLESPNVPPEDKQKIIELLKKPWNLYIRRHSALTEKSTILKEHVLR